VKTMARIAEQAEQDAFAADIYKNIWHAMDHSDNTNAVSAAACTGSVPSASTSASSSGINRF